MVMRVGRWLPAAGALASVLALAAVSAPGEARAQPGRCGDPAQRPWCDPSLSPDERTGLLLPRMTADEKIAMLAADDLLGGPLGGFIETAHADVDHGVPRLGIPPVHMADGPAGVRQGKATALPAPIALAAGFDPRAAGLYGRTVAWEARHRGNDVVFGPTVDVLRTPRNGRTFEFPGSRGRCSRAGPSPERRYPPARTLVAVPGPLDFRVFGLPSLGVNCEIAGEHDAFWTC